jgi:hypothetical protein
MSFLTSSGVAKYILIDLDFHIVLRISGDIFPVKAIQLFPTTVKRLNKSRCWCTRGRVGARTNILDFFHLNKISTHINNVMIVFPNDVGTTMREFLYNVFSSTVF